MQVREEKGQRPGRGLVPQVQGRQDGGVDQFGIANLGQLDQPRPARKATSKLGSGSDREAGLADTARPDQTHQAGRGELPLEFGKLVAPAYEARRLSREVSRST